ncbi:MAG TPA: hypothetical protein VGA77_00260 [Propylenella sp.]
MAPEQRAAHEAWRKTHRPVLARFRIGETTAGEMLVSEGLARAWRGRMEKWCGG